MVLIQQELELPTLCPALSNYPWKYLLFIYLQILMTDIPLLPLWFRAQTKSPRHSLVNLIQHRVVLKFLQVCKVSSSCSPCHPFTAFCAESKKCSVICSLENVLLSGLQVLWITSVLRSVSLSFLFWECSPFLLSRGMPSHNTHPLDSWSIFVVFLYPWWPKSISPSLFKITLKTMALGWEWRRYESQ